MENYPIYLIIWVLLEKLCTNINTFLILSSPKIAVCKK